MGAPLLSWSQVRQVGPDVHGAEGGGVGPWQEQSCGTRTAAR